MTSGCATKVARPQPYPLPPTAPGAVALPDGLPVPSPELRDGYAIARTALALRGIPYRLGGTDTSGFDCSGLVQYVFALNGLGLPRIVRDQYRYGQPVKLDELEPGDLVFFETQGGGAVFSTGSIAWCGSLSWNAYDNNVERITHNVLKRFIGV